MVNKKSSSAKYLEEESMPETEASKEFTNFFLDHLKDVYWAEKHLNKALLKIKKAVAESGLKNMFGDHIVMTQIHTERLEQVFDLLSEIAKAKKSEAMAGLVDETDDILDETSKGSKVRDAGLMLVVQKINNYKITTYGVLIQLARTMGNEDIISLLEATLADEQTINETLSTVIENTVGSNFTENEQTSTNNDQHVAAVYDSINLTGKITNK